nr:ComF family protein [uncultured Desulfobulbus sp.]
MGKLFQSLQDLLFPPHCLGCSRRLDHSRPPLFCSACLERLAFISSPLCPSCGTPFATGNDHLCTACLQERYSFDLARSLLFYQKPSDALILPLKFGGQLSGLPTLTSLVSNWTHRGDISKPDYILPVPLHVHRLRQRGFNQARLIAQACFPHWKEKIRPNLLVRSQATTPQVELSGKKRRKNLKHAFTLQAGAEMRKKSILVVDDVFTTGSTVNECAKVLKRQGASRVEVFTLARSVPQHPRINT